VVTTKRCLPGERLEIVADMPMMPTRKVIKPELVRRLLAQAELRGPSGGLVVGSKLRAAYSVPAMATAICTSACFNLELGRRV